MKPELQRRVQRYGWDKAADYYETGWEEQLWPAHERLLSAVDLKPGEYVLDVSCGTGLVTLPSANLVKPNGRVIGIDLSDGMVEKARLRLESQEIENVSFAQMDAESLDFPDKSFDVLICSLGFMYFPYPEMALQEMFRVLVPGGRLVALIWGARQNCGWADIFPIVDRRVETDVCPLFFQLGTGGRLSKEFEKTGFKKVQSDQFIEYLCFEDDKQACIAAFLGGPVAMAYQKFDEKVKQEVQREYLGSIREYSDNEGFSIPGEYVIASGIKP